MSSVFVLLLFPLGFWLAVTNRALASYSAINTAEDVLDGRLSGCKEAIDCCEDLTNEINKMKNDLTELTSRFDHFNDRLNDNTFKIVENQLEIQTNRKQTDTNTNDVDTNSNDIATNSNDINTNSNNVNINTNNINSNTHDIATNLATINTLTATSNLRISYCGYREGTATEGIITFEKLLTNVNSLNHDGLDFGTGQFTAPTDGTYLVTINFYTGDYHDDFNISPVKNGLIIDEGRIFNYGTDQSGRAMTLDLKQNDILYVTIVDNAGYIYYITFCVTLIK